MISEEGLTDAQRSLLEWLRAACTTAPATGRRYGSTWDIVLNLGAWWRPAPYPPELPRGPERACYANAARLAKRETGLRYVEGFASPELNISLALEHAWTVTEDGTVLDPTWKSPGLAYLGIPFSLSYRKRVLAARPRRLNSYVLLDTHANPELLTAGLPADARV